jgi:hypothetical protein
MLEQKGLDAIVELCHDVSARIHGQVVGNFSIEPTMYNIVAFKLFGYALNTFKSIFYLLPHTVYEQAMALHRTLWETGVNFEWISRDPESRAELFLQFTAVEHRKFIRKRIETARRHRDPEAILALTNELGEFERILDRQLGGFRHRDAKRKTRYRDRFSSHSLEEVVREVGGVWADEYDRDYVMGCMSSHGAPGAVLFPLIDTPDFEIAKARDIERSALVGVMSIEVITRCYRLYLPILRKEDETYLRELPNKVRTIYGVGLA